MQATIYAITPFDASVGSTIKFNWTGNQVFQNRCIIKRNDTNEVVYDKTVDSFKLEHKIDLSVANLENGQKYNAFITVFDKEGNESDIQSLGTVFLCLETPVFQFSNVSDGQILTSSSYEFMLEYSQNNGELLDSWSITVYSKSLVELTTSGVKYDTTNMVYTASGFSNNSEYVIRGKGLTVNGMAVDTGDINLTISYDVSSIFSTLDPVNVREYGAIHLRSNITSSDGITEKEQVYIDNEYLDLRDDFIIYDQGFSLSKDFSFVIVFYGMKPNDIVLTMYSEDESFELNVTYRITKVNENGTMVTKSLFELDAVNNGIHYVLYSNKLPLISDTDKIGLKIMRNNSFYDIQIYNYTLEEGV